MLSSFDKYVLIINAIGFVLFAFNTFLYNHTESMSVDKLVTAAACMGGCAGIVASIFIFDRKAEKDNML